MSSGDARVALERALELSRELLAVAELGDVAAAVDLDAARLELLKSACETPRTTSMTDRDLLQEIAQLNDQAIGCLEHHRRRKARDMDMASVGRRALIAYSPTRQQQR
jgi:hypothetical protein